MRYAIFAVLVFLLGLTITAAALTPDESALLNRALSLYRDMHAGKYKIVTTATTISNGRHILKIEISAAGMTFPGEMSFPVPPVRVETPGNGLFLMGGTLWGVQYQRRLYGRLWLNTGLGWDDQAMFWGGIGWQWGK